MPSTRERTKRMRQLSGFSLTCAVAALAISPAQAVELPRATAPAAQPDYATRTVLNDGAGEAENRRRYRRHDDGIDAGDIIAGAVIIGGIFAIASAVDSSNRDSRRDSDYVSNGAFDRAIDACVNQVERQQRIGAVENVGRTRTGYSVSGTLYNGSGFTCAVSEAGRVTNVDYGYGSAGYQGGGQAYGNSDYGGVQYADSQYSDDTYARARAGTYSAPDSYSGSGGTAQPAYPGGPVPGEDYDDYPTSDGYDSGEPY